MHVSADKHAFACDSPAAKDDATLFDFSADQRLNGVPLLLTAGTPSTSTSSISLKSLTGARGKAAVSRVFAAAAAAAVLLPLGAAAAAAAAASAAAASAPKEEDLRSETRR
jgi:hypothetical protein